MNKAAIKNFAIWARNKLIGDISYRAGLMGITESGIGDALPQSTGDTEFYEIGTAEPYAIHGTEIKQRRKLVEVIRRKEADSDYATAFRYIIEEVAYTWFNRLIAVRFMEVNDYLPSRIRVLSSETGKLEPDLVTHPFDSDLEFTAAEQEALISYKQNNQLDEAFRLLFRKQCNALHEILPVLFETTSDYTELLLNLSIIDQEGVVYHLVHDIPEEDFNIEQGGQVEIIGWLYQYYNTEPKADAFAKKGKITKEEIPAVTQLFTPDWIVRYMVENSLGRLWISGQLAVDNGEWLVDSEEWSEQERRRIAKEKELAERMGWKYYLPEAEQEPEVRKELNELTTNYSKLATDPTGISFADICAGSGHILVYAFDVLMQIYESAGYSQRDAAQSILEHNLYGLDIDDRAAQLAYFAVMMKARQYDRRIFSRGIQPHVYAIQESNNVNRAQLKFFGAGLSEEERNTAAAQMEGLLDTLTDAKEYGSILNVADYDWELLRRFADDLETQGQLSLDSVGAEETAEQLKQLIDIGETLARKYWVTCTNPPYASVSNLSPKVNNFVKKNYPDSKADFFAVFIERCHEMTQQNGYQAMITQHSWMFLSSFEKLRIKMMQTDTINMAHLGARAFEEIGGEVVQTTTFVRRYSHVDGYKGTYCRLIEPTSQQGKEEMFLAGENRYFAEQDNFSKIPGSPVAYWVSESTTDCFSHKTFKDYFFAGHGLLTGHDEDMIFYWHEIRYDKIGFDFDSEDCMHASAKIYAPMAKGGDFRKWYGNLWLVAKYDRTTIDYMKKYPKFTQQNKDRYFKEGVTWTEITSGTLGARYLPAGCIFNHKGPSVFATTHKGTLRIAGFMTSVVCNHFTNLINPTITCSAGVMNKVPIVGFDSWNELLSDECISISKEDWDSYETSWDFKRHPLL